LGDGSRIILDAGSGIRALGESTGPCAASLLLSHYHWDHIQGFPFFGPIYSPESSIRVFGPEYEGRGPSDLLDGQSAAPYFPAPSSEWCGVVDCSPIPSEPFSIGSASITAGRLSHPGPTFGYRIEDGGQILVYMSDNEVDRASPELLSSMVELAARADILIHDCQYTEPEYAVRHGWGHSTPRQAVRLAQEAEVSRLYLFHHNPTHSDESVISLASEARRRAPGMDIVVAREGDGVGPPLSQRLDSRVSPDSRRSLGATTGRTRPLPP